jgi:hypothetical protein
VVITHDDDWRDVFRDVSFSGLFSSSSSKRNKDGIKPTGQTFSELQQAIFDRFEIMEDDG